ncbi:MAG: tRNA (cytidine(34)-2'-O)-methyltransferase [Chthoniobacterales bacterium]|nr:tRNA (cytidine(34)-2'-O)-methyltransferase [Chthoniobacterales bacterium]
MFNVVLVEPEIPPNTGNIGRLCLATRSTLHLVQPLGFTLDDRQLHRAGLDYWDEVDVQLWPSFGALQASRPDNARMFFLTTKTPRIYHTQNFRPGDFFVFGRETKGLPERLLQQNTELLLTIPMHGTRSLNLATAVAIVLYEAVRQNAHATQDRDDAAQRTSTARVE